MFYVASRDGLMPEIASMIHVDRRTPLPAAVITVRTILSRYYHEVTCASRCIRTLLYTQCMYSSFYFFCH